MPENEEFYKGKAWEMVLSELKELRQDVKTIKSRLDWVYGWAAGVAVVASFLWSFIKDKFRW